MAVVLLGTWAFSACRSLCWRSSTVLLAVEVCTATRLVDSFGACPCHAEPPLLHRMWVLHVHCGTAEAVDRVFRPLPRHRQTHGARAHQRRRHHQQLGVRVLHEQCSAWLRV